MHRHLKMYYRSIIIIIITKIVINVEKITLYTSSTSTSYGSTIWASFIMWLYRTQDREKIVFLVTCIPQTYPFPFFEMKQHLYPKPLTVNLTK